jgi:hypothetical protein
MNEQIENQQETVLPKLREMKIGDSVIFPVSRMSYIRSACTSFGMQWDKKFSTRTDRQLKSIKVTRVY